MLNNITIGPITIHMYGLMFGIAYLCAYFVSCKRAKNYGLNEDILWGILICAILGTLIGSRLLFYLVSIPQIIKNPSIIWNFRNGYVVYGGIMCGVLLGYFYCQKKGASFLNYFDLVMPSVSLAQGIGRIGCFFAGCCYGRETDSWFHIIYTHSEYAPNHVPLIPTQLISSAGNFIIAALLFWYASKSKKAGTVGALYMILYSIGRFIIEMFRNDYRGTWGMLSTSQIISIGIMAAGVFFMFLFYKKEN